MFPSASVGRDLGLASALLTDAPFFGNNSFVGLLLVLIQRHLRCSAPMNARSSPLWRAAGQTECVDDPEFALSRWVCAK